MDSRSHTPVTAALRLCLHALLTGLLALVATSSTISSRRRSLSRNRASYPRTVAMATAAPSSGPMN
ncbi:sensor histidine kinase, partial [Streptomyces sp. WAC04770]